MVKTNRMNIKEAEEYRNAKKIFEAQMFIKKEDAERILASLKEQLKYLRKEGCRQPSFEETNSEPLVEEKTLHNNFCRKCGAKLQEDSKFCHKCGTEVIKF